MGIITKVLNPPRIGGPHDFPQAFVSLSDMKARMTDRCEQKKMSFMVQDMPPTRILSATPRA